MDVKGIIKKKGYTIEKVADELGITRVTLMQNLARNPTVNTLQKIADVIDCKVGEFFYDEIESRESSGFFCPKCGAGFEIKLKD